MADLSKLEVKPRDARWRCDPGKFRFETTDELPCCTEIIGQDRAIKAIQLGLEVKTRGYNIYVSGLTGTGKSTTIKRLLESMKLEKRELRDICYVHNLKSPDMPVCIMLPAGRGRQFKREMRRAYETLSRHIPTVFQQEPFKNEQKKILERFKEKKNAMVREFEAEIAEKGFSLFEVQYGPFTRPEIMPVIDGEAVSIEKLPELVDAGKLTEERLNRILEDQEALMDKMEEFLKKNREMDRELSEKMAAVEKKYAKPIVRMCIRDIADNFAYDKVRSFLADLEEYVVENLSMFKESGEGEGKEDRKSGRAVEFDVNIIVDNSETVGVPVIIETSPRYSNLFGTIERSSEGKDDYKTDFTRIRAGSLIRANGGFLVLNLSDIAEEPAVWPALKRALKNQQITIQGLDSLFLLPISALKPEPIDLDVKVVLIGDAYSYQCLYNYDEDFRKIFKVKADFDSVMPNNKRNLTKYAEFIRYLSDAEGLLPFHKTAVAAIAEEGTRLAGEKKKLSTRFSDVADIVRESDYWAKKDGAKLIKDVHVERAVEEKVNRVNLIEEKIRELIRNGVILLDMDGARVGQINGLSVYDMGDYSFGKPSRITAETAMGRAGVINIEREADLSGKTHNKGVLILEGYLRKQYAQDKPLTMSASICFEQSYSGIDGDSASSTEIYALLSSLAEVPLRQDIAVTGSVNQKGDIQPIGGVNEKIEGFFDICRLKRLTGTQGVIIPALNVRDLMLRRDVVESIKKRRFHIYAIKHIDQGIEILTGMRAGRRLSNGKFQKGTLHFLVDQKLRRFAEQIKEFHETE